MNEQTLRTLVTADSVRSPAVIGMGGGYAISVRYGSTESLLKSSRGETRLFTLDAASKFLRRIGLPRFVVDASNYEPGRIRKPRPDRAEALRRTRTNPRQAMLV
jgi:hypothetical protein